MINLRVIDALTQTLAAEGCLQALTHDSENAVLYGLSANGDVYSLAKKDQQVPISR